jgi:hypothetical protein
MKYDLINCPDHEDVSVQVEGFYVFIFQSHFGEE